MKFSQISEIILGWLTSLEVSAIFVFYYCEVKCFEI